MRGNEGASKKREHSDFHANMTLNGKRESWEDDYPVRSLVRPPRVKGKSLLSKE